MNKLIIGDQSAGVNITPVIDRSLGDEVASIPLGPELWCRMCGEPTTAAEYGFFPLSPGRHLAMWKMNRSSCCGGTIYRDAALRDLLPVGNEMEFGSDRAARPGHCAGLVDDGLSVIDTKVATPTKLVSTSDGFRLVSKDPDTLRYRWVFTAGEPRSVDLVTDDGKVTFCQCNDFLQHRFCVHQAALEAAIRDQAEDDQPQFEFERFTLTIRSHVMSVMHAEITFARDMGFQLITEGWQVGAWDGGYRAKVVITKEAVIV